MIYIVDAHSYDKNGIPLRASAMSLSLKERGSTATITLDDREGIKVTDILKQWFRDDADPGKNMMWRATKLTDNWSTNTPSLQLEHVINTLKDSIVFGKVGPAEITGNSKATTCSAKATIEWLLKKQVTKDWKMGDFDVADKTQAYNFESDTIYDALETVCSTLTGVWWEYDTKKYPFTLHIRKRVDTGSNKDTAETMLRCARNIRTISRSVDKSSMYTRFYPIGSEDLHLKDSKNNNAPYVDQNTDKYGIIEHVETDNTITTNSKLKSWAEDELRIHARKIETIEVEGLELSAATGEPMDKIRLGKMCQIVVKTDAVSTDMTYRIIQLSYPDKISKPEVVKITLSNKRDDLPKMVAEAKKKAAKSGRVAARKEKETKQIILNTVKNVRITGPTNNQYTLQYQLVKDTDDVWNNAGNFSRAVTSWGLTASEGTITVTALPQNQKKLVYVRAGAATRAGNVYTGDIQYSGDKKSWSKTGESYSVDATERYNQGKRDAVVVGNWDNGTFTAYNQSNSSKKVTTAIFDLTSEDVSWSGRTGTISLYANKDGGETKLFTGKTLTVTAPVQHPTIGFDWGNTGILIVSTNPSASSNRTVAFFDPVSADVTLSGSTLNVKLYASIDGSETKTFTNRTLPVPLSMVHPTISPTWGNTGTLTITTTPESSVPSTVAIFDPTSSDVTLSGSTLYVSLYASMDGSETRTYTNRILPVPTSAIHPTIGLNWGNNGTLTITTTPASSSPRTVAFFTPTAAEITWSSNYHHGEFPLCVSVDGSETRTNTGKTMSFDVPNQVQTLGQDWNNSGTLTVTANPSGQTATMAIFDLRSQDVTWNGVTGTISLYANKNGGETRYATNRKLTVTAPFTSYIFKKAYGVNDQPYKGNIYDANGNMLGGNYYWYGYGTNFGSAVNVELYRHN